MPKVALEGGASPGFAHDVRAVSEICDVGMDAAFESERMMMVRRHRSADHIG